MVHCHSSQTHLLDPSRNRDYFMGLHCAVLFSFGLVWFGCTDPFLHIMVLVSVLLRQAQSLYSQFCSLMNILS